MPEVTVAEAYESRASVLSRDNPNSTRVYTVTGTADESVAIAAVRSAAPASVTLADGVASYGLPRQSYTSRPLHVDSENEEQSRWSVEVSYAIASGGAQQETGSSFTSIDTTGGTTHLSHAREHIADYGPPGQTPANFRGAINVSEQGVGGVDVPIPQYSFSETHYQADLNQSVIFALTGRVNSQFFKGFAPGECLFLGARAARRGAEEDWEVTYQFACLPNESSLSVGNITGITKRGWDYLWVRYGDKHDDTTNRKTRVALSAHVEQVHAYADLNGLGI